MTDSFTSAEISTEMQCTKLIYIIILKMRNLYTISYVRGIHLFQVNHSLFVYVVRFSKCYWHKDVVLRNHFCPWNILFPLSSLAHMPYCGISTIPPLHLHWCFGDLSHYFSNSRDFILIFSLVHSNKRAYRIIGRLATGGWGSTRFRSGCTRLIIVWCACTCTRLIMWYTCTLSSTTTRFRNYNLNCEDIIL